MMGDFDLDFRPAVWENVGLFIALCGPSSSGKTYSAMAIAKGIVGPGKRFAVIDTENRRSRHKSRDFDFDVLDLTAPYNAHRYEQAVKKAYDKGYGAIIVDSASHEHEGEGGYLDQQESALKERVDRYMERHPNEKRWVAEEKFTPTSWTDAKRERKRMILSLLAFSAKTPIIFCFRAEEKVFKSVDGRLVAQNPPVWTPTGGKTMPYEMTVSFMLDPERPGYIMKRLKTDIKLDSLFPLDKRLDEECGKRIAEWSRGKGDKPQPTAPMDRPAESPAASPSPATAGTAAQPGGATGDTHTNQPVDNPTPPPAPTLEGRTVKELVEIARAKRASLKDGFNLFIRFINKTFPNKQFNDLDKSDLLKLIEWADNGAVL